MGGHITTWVLDLDGVVWLGDKILHGSAEAIEKLRNQGIEVGFVTNLSLLSVSNQEEKLESAGIPAKGKVITSAMAAAGLVEPREKVLICGGAGIYEAVKARGAEIVDSETDKPDAVVVGLNPEFDNYQCMRAMRAVRAGARLIGTNHDPTYPTSEGLFPGGGAQLAAIATAAETTATIAGKPNEPMMKCVKQVLGEVDLVVGDRPDSDGLLAKVLGADFALVLSGVTKQDDLPTDPMPQFVSQDLTSLVDEVI